MRLPDGDGPQPRLELLGIAEILDVPTRIDQDFLGYVIGIGSSPKGPTQASQIVEMALVAGIKGLDWHAIPHGSSHTP
jgi:hypothetical protein